MSSTLAVSTKISFVQPPFIFALFDTTNITCRKENASINKKKINKDK